jgi:putative intracellular protease/amidase
MKMNKMSRRVFGGLAAGSLAAPVLAAERTQASGAEPQRSRQQFPPLHGGRKPVVGMLLYPGMTLLDLLGPQTVLSTSCNIHLVWKNRSLLETDSGVVLRPNATFAGCPQDLDVLFVGGGPGQIEVMQDPETLRFMADRGARAKYVTSVCSGSLILAAAGLLQGYRSGSHWAALDALSLFGAIPVKERVVTDRNRISGGGVTAGIDFGLVLLAKLLGDDVAKLTQLALEYDPQPPFAAGSPSKAGPEITKKALDWMAPVNADMIQVVQQAAKAMGSYTPLVK